MTISNTDDFINVSEITDRIEALEGELQVLVEEDDTTTDGDTKEEAEEELATLTRWLDECAGGGDHEWRGTWYYGTLIHESHFEDYARELAEDIGAINRDAGWPNQYIDWKAAAAALEQDYTHIDLDGEAYLSR